MTTVQDLINLHRAAQEYGYESILILKDGGHVERYSDVNNLKINGDMISFISTTDIRNVYPSAIPKVRQIDVFGKIVERCKRII